tara:strand:+ start:939 stop:1283 length:345 start_codon:yes stop_codon:yes gene_type:complete
MAESSFKFDPKNRCLECGIDMGEYNPRQYCDKWRCCNPDINMCSDEEFAHEYGDNKYDDNKYDDFDEKIDDKTDDETNELLEIINSKDIIIKNGNKRGSKALEDGENDKKRKRK